MQSRGEGARDLSRRKPGGTEGLITETKFPGCQRPELHQTGPSARFPPSPVFSLSHFPGVFIGIRAPIC